MFKPEDRRKWSGVAGGVLFGAGLASLLAKGEMLLTLLAVASGLLLLLLFILLTAHASKTTLWTSLILSAVILFGAIYFINRTTKMSPATTTLTLFEMNDWEQGKLWEGSTNEPINLSKTPTLNAKQRSDNQSWYRLVPAIRHETRGASLYLTLKLKIRLADQLKPQSINFIQGAWDQETVGDYIEYTTQLDLANYRELRRVQQSFAFERTHPGTYEVILEVDGIDNKERQVHPKNTVVRLILR